MYKSTLLVKDLIIGHKDIGGRTVENIVESGCGNIRRITYSDGAQASYHYKAEFFVTNAMAAINPYFEIVALYDRGRVSRKIFEDVKAYFDNKYGADWKCPAEGSTV